MLSNILRQIWSNPNCLTLMCAESSAEFAVHPNADWLFYTGVLPADPVGRFVSTVGYVQRLILAANAETYSEISRQIRRIHTDLEAQRGQPIPDVAYQDVLFMNLEYSVRSFPLIFGRELEIAEKDTIVRDFREWGSYMEMTDLPADYEDYLALRQQRFEAFQYSEWTDKLLVSYRRALGPVGFYFLVSVYGGLVNPQILQTLRVRPNVSSWLFRRLCHPACQTGLSKVLSALIRPTRAKQVLGAWADLALRAGPGRVVAP